MLTQEQNAARIQLLWQLSSLAEQTHDTQKCLALSLRLLLEYLSAEAAVVAHVGPSREPTQIRLVYPKAGTWTLASLASLLDTPPAEGPGPAIFSFLKRRGRTWGTVALSRPGRRFTRQEDKTLRRAARMISKQLAVIDMRRIANVRAKIDRKLIEQLQPNDLFYQVLHGIRSLTGYDHSSALYIFRSPNDREIRVAAELLKPHTKSTRVNDTLELPREGMAQLSSGEVQCWHREGDAWESDSGADGKLAVSFDSGSDLGDYGRERSMILAPLLSGESLVGVLKIAFGEADMAGTYEAELVRSFVPHIVVALRNADRFEHLQSELAAAREFQRGLLPAPELVLPGATICFRSRPCEQLGGDFFDVVWLGDARAMLLLTDVSGHGAKAAMPTALIKAAFRDQSGLSNPARVLSSIWNGLRFFDPTLMVTALCIEIDAKAHVIRWANAGHPRPLVRRPGGPVEELEEADAPIFPAVEGTWRLHARALEPGSRLLGYTDGIIESEDAEHEFGIDRLHGRFGESTRANGAALDEILASFDRHRGGRAQEDDCTLFLLSFTESR